MGTFTSFWTTLTFQLSGVFHLTPLEVGLFALPGIAPVLLNLAISSLVTSRIHPHGTAMLGISMTLTAVLIGTFIGTFSLAGPVLWAFIGDLGVNTVIVANRMAIAHVDPTAHNAVNSLYMIFTFAGQLFGTAVGNALYARGGWTWSGALNIAQLAAATLILILRGPHEQGWAGWRGGWDLRRSEVVGNGAADSDGSPPSISISEGKGGEECGRLDGS